MLMFYGSLFLATEYCLMPADVRSGEIKEMVPSVVNVVTPTCHVKQLFLQNTLRLIAQSKNNCFDISRQKIQTSLYGLRTVHGQLFVMDRVFGSELTLTSPAYNECGDTPNSFSVLYHLSSLKVVIDIFFSSDTESKGTFIHNFFGFSSPAHPLYYYHSPSRFVFSIL